MTFRKESAYTSNLGSMASVILFVTVGILVTLNFIEFFLQKIDNAQIGQSDIIQDKYDMDLFELNYRFAVQ